MDEKLDKANILIEKIETRIDILMKILEYNKKEVEVKTNNCTYTHATKSFSNLS